MEESLGLFGSTDEFECVAEVAVKGKFLRLEAVEMEFGCVVVFAREDFGWLGRVFGKLDEECA